MSMVHKRDLVMARCAWMLMLAGLFAAMGCDQKSVDRTPAKVTSEDVRHETHGGDHASKESAMLMVTTEPEVVHADQPATLRLMIHDVGGALLKDFETVHEQRIHLIIVREGLDQFAHIHPQLDPDGNMTAVFTFPTGGKYRLYADHKPLGKDQATAIAELQVSGDTPPAAELTPNAPGNITGDGLKADVSVENAEPSGATKIEFRLMDASDAPVTDLEPYMGAMGHLVIISADGKQYVHAHAAEENSTDGKVQFEAHFAKPGIYKAWGQFQRGDKIHILPFVINTAS